MKVTRQVLWNRGGFGWLEGFSERHGWLAKVCSASEGGSLYDNHTIYYLQFVNWMKGTCCSR